MVVVALLGLFACLAVGLGPSTLSDGAGQVVATATATATRQSTTAGHDGDRAAPCVVRADCAGGFALVTVALLPIVALAANRIGPIATPATRVTTKASSLRSRLSADRLLRPPQA
jgi:hypothetical protein